MARCDVAIVVHCVTTDSSHTQVLASRGDWQLAVTAHQTALTFGAGGGESKAWSIDLAWPGPRHKEIEISALQLPGLLLGLGHVQEAVSAMSARTAVGWPTSSEDSESDQEKFGEFWVLEKTLTLLHLSSAGNSAWDEPLTAKCYSKPQRSGADGTISNTLAWAAQQSSGDAAKECCPSVGEKWGSQITLGNEFLRELYLMHTQLGVFLDELGAFDLSLMHLNQAFKLCGLRSGLHNRIAFAIPVVVESHEAAANVGSRLHTAAVSMQNEPLSQSDLGAGPEFSTDLLFTITPPTMFLGYLGLGSKEIAGAMNKAYAAQYPSLLRIPDAVHTTDADEETTEDRSETAPEPEETVPSEDAHKNYRHAADQSYGLMQDGHITQDQMEEMLLSQRQLFGLKGATHQDYEDYLKDKEQLAKDAELFRQAQQQEKLEANFFQAMETPAVEEPAPEPAAAEAEPGKTEADKNYRHSADQVTARSRAHCVCASFVTIDAIRLTACSKMGISRKSSWKCCCCLSGSCWG
jgi:hypothetical protein